MKKIAILTALCMIFALAGCQSKAPAGLNAKKGNGAPTMNLQDGNGQAATKKQDATKSQPQTSEDTSSGKAPLQNAGNSGLNGPDSQKSAGDIIEIKEKMFVAQINDIYFNAEDYLGKTIKYEGIFCSDEIPETGEKYYSVIRYGPGCCGVDANAGFEVQWDKGYPKPDDWVEAVGVLEEYENDGFKYLRLSLSSLTVLSKRGAEYVSQ